MGRLSLFKLSRGQRVKRWVSSILLVVTPSFQVAVTSSDSQGHTHPCHLNQLTCILTDIQLFPRGFCMLFWLVKIEIPMRALLSSWYLLSVGSLLVEIQLFLLLSLKEVLRGKMLQAKMNIFLIIKNLVMVMYNVKYTIELF